MQITTYSCSNSNNYTYKLNIAWTSSSPVITTACHRHLKIMPFIIVCFLLHQKKKCIDRSSTAAQQNPSLPYTSLRYITRTWEEEEMSRTNNLRCEERIKTRSQTKPIDFQLNLIKRRELLLVERRCVKETVEQV